MKGKYAARAANRRASHESESMEEVYKRNIVKLTSERDEARTERDKAMMEWKKEVRILRAQLNEGMSPQVEAVTRELNRMREDRDAVKRNHEAKRQIWGKCWQRIAEHMEKEHGLTRRLALDATTTLLVGEEKTFVTTAEKRFAQIFGDEAATVLRMARDQ